MTPKLSQEELSSLFLEISLLLHAGVMVGDALSLLAEEAESDERVLLIQMADAVDGGASLSAAMREVIWSTAVQHGPAGAARIFDRADELSGKPTDPAYERKLISNVYKLRAGQFGSSTEAVQAAVQNRFRQEKNLALNMLDGGGRTALA